MESTRPTTGCGTKIKRIDTRRIREISDWKILARSAMGVLSNSLTILGKEGALHLAWTSRENVRRMEHITTTTRRRDEERIEYTAAETLTIKQGRPCKCQICGAKYRNVNDLKIHHREGCRPEDELRLECPKCDKTWKNEESLARHLKSHEANITCPDCGQCWQSRYDFEKHVKRITAEKKFLCPFCGNTYKMQKTIKKHAHVYQENKKMPHPKPTLTK